MNNVNNMHSGAGKSLHACTRARLREEGSYRSYRSRAALNDDRAVTPDLRSGGGCDRREGAENQPFSLVWLREPRRTTLVHVIRTLPLAGVGRLCIHVGVRIARFSTKRNKARQINYLQNPHESGPGFQRPQTSLSMATSVLIASSIAPGCGRRRVLIGPRAVVGTERVTAPAASHCALRSVRLHG